jgi:hypothetical protein
MHLILLRICRRSVLPYTRFCNCLLITITFYTLLTSLFCIQMFLSSQYMCSVLSKRSVLKSCDWLLAKTWIFVGYQFIICIRDLVKRRPTACPFSMHSLVVMLNLLSLGKVKDSLANTVRVSWNLKCYHKDQYIYLTKIKEWSKGS